MDNIKNSIFKALVVEKHNDQYIRSIKKKSINDLPDGDLLVKVKYSSLNYKDALSAIGNKGVTKNFPHTPGIDAAGVVVQSNNSDLKVNDRVIVTSYDLGMDTDGGFGQYIRVPSNWALRLPAELSMQESMILGTAGLTAGAGILKITEQVKPKDGKIIVSGATGGVGSLVVNILSKIGYQVSAITGKENEKAFLTSLGATEIISRNEFENLPDRPLLKADFAGGFDTVGGVILQNIVKSVDQWGIVVNCGNAASPKLNTTVYPFILRGLTLTGIATQNYPMPQRIKVWNKMAKEWKPDKMMDLFTEISLDELDHKIDLILQGKLKGRTILNLEE